MRVHSIFTVEACVQSAPLLLTARYPKKKKDFCIVAKRMGENLIVDSSSHSVEFNNVIDGFVPVSLPPGNPW